MSAPWAFPNLFWPSSSPHLPLYREPRNKPGGKCYVHEHLTCDVETSETASSGRAPHIQNNKTKNHGFLEYLRAPEDRGNESPKKLIFLGNSAVSGRGWVPPGRPKGRGLGGELLWRGGSKETPCAKRRGGARSLSAWGFNQFFFDFLKPQLEPEQRQPGCINNTRGPGKPSPQVLGAGRRHIFA